ncbi:MULTISPECIES: hypothetical protein [Salipiger]|uniref:hypothetical protein n=1 Tax=Salipiger TaxID=263377 RepID=UPI003518AB24
MAILMNFARIYRKIQNTCPFFERNARICALSGAKISRDLPVALADTVISAQEQAVSMRLRRGFPEVLKASPRATLPTS